MKIAFNIARMNRYRDLSAVIAVALKRGWDVECWHAKYEDNRHKENTPCLKKVPFFRYGTPKIIEYCKEQDLRYLLTNSGCSVVVDTDPRHFSLPDLCEHSENRPLTVLVDGIANPVLRTTYVKLPKFDIFFTPSYDQTDLTIKLRSRTRNSIIEEIWKNKKTLGKKVCKRLEKNVSNQWNEGDYTLYKNRCVVVGTPYLDDLNLVDRDNIRKSWGISNSAKVVGYLPSPWDMPLGFFWGDLNMSNNYLERFICCLRHKKCNFYKYICKTPTDIDYVKLIRKFCDNNDAFFVTKLRHSRNATPYLKNNVDLILGEDQYHPHTALELYAASDIVFGYTSAGSMECVAAGTPYVDLELPEFPKNFYTATSLQTTNSWDGVVWSFSPNQAFDILPKASIGDFKINNIQQIAYLKHFTTYHDYKSSSRMLDIIEEKVARKP